ncbi:hypothetical protein Lal_00038486 [Lupinus albus]|nr:hypothetical protein Lal_00038486 [Lupinus albus]
MYLKYRKWYAEVALSPGVTIRDFMDAPLYIRTWHIPKVDLDTYKYGVIFRLYDVVCMLLKEDLRCLPVVDVTTRHDESCCQLNISSRVDVTSNHSDVIYVLPGSPCRDLAVREWRRRARAADDRVEILGAIRRNIYNCYKGPVRRKRWFRLSDYFFAATSTLASHSESEALSDLNGRGKPLDPYLRGNRIQMLREAYKPKDLIVPPDSLYGWMAQWLNYVLWYNIVAVDPGVLLQYFLDAPVVARHLKVSRTDPQAKIESIFPGNPPLPLMPFAAPHFFLLVCGFSPSRKACLKAFFHSPVEQSLYCPCPISREKAFDASLSGSGLNEGIESEVTYRILPGQELTQRKRHLLKFIRGLGRLIQCQQERQSHLITMTPIKLSFRCTYPLRAKCLSFQRRHDMRSSKF